MDPCILYSNDAKPSLWFQISNEDGVVDLSASTTTVSFKLRAKGSTTVLHTIACTKVKSSGATGWVQVDFSADELDDLTAGRYEGELSVSFNGSVQTVAWYYHYSDTEIDDWDDTFPIKIKEPFGT